MDLLFLSQELHTYTSPVERCLSYYIKLVYKISSSCELTFQYFCSTPIHLLGKLLIYFFSDFFLHISFYDDETNLHRAQFKLYAVIVCGKINYLSETHPPLWKIPWKHMIIILMTASLDVSNFTRIGGFDNLFNQNYNYVIAPI